VTKRIRQSFASNKEHLVRDMSVQCRVHSSTFHAEIDLVVALEIISHILDRSNQLGVGEMLGSQTIDPVPALANDPVHCGKETIGPVADLAP
jgi:hypothetical protein